MMSSAGTADFCQYRPRDLDPPGHGTHCHLDLDAQRSPLDEPMPGHDTPRDWPPHALQLHQRSALAGTWHATRHTCTLKSARIRLGMAHHPQYIRDNPQLGTGKTWHARAERANQRAVDCIFQGKQDMA